MVSFTLDKAKLKLCNLIFEKILRFVKLCDLHMIVTKKVFQRSYIKSFINKSMFSVIMAFRLTAYNTTKDIPTYRR